jgi:probable HAF family extracellular repeat protein
MRRLIVPLTVVVLLAVVVENAWGIVQYTVTDLGGLTGRPSSFAYDINASGQVVGYARAGINDRRAFLYSGGTMTDLGTMGGSMSEAYGINASGQIVGWSYTASDAAQRAFLYSGGHMTDLGTLGGANSWANAINESGQIAGSANWVPPPYGGTRAFLYSGGRMTSLGTLGGEDGGGTAINARGQVVGYSTTPGNVDCHAFLWSGTSMLDFGSLHPGFSYAFSINDSGQVAGILRHTSGYDRAFLYSAGEIIVFGTLGGNTNYASDINAGGQIVGWSYTNGNTEAHAALCSGSTMVDLNDLIAPASGWTLREATAINDSGWIVGHGLHNGNERAFLLTPVPEPSTFVLLGMGAVGLLAYAWRRRKRAASLLATTGVFLAFLTGVAQADVFNMGGTRNADGSWTGLASIEFVTVGNPGNLGEQSRLPAGYSDPTYYGGVAYTYQIGKYEITNAQWREFLTAKASTSDPYGLYSANMSGTYGGIGRSWSLDHYVYTAKGGDANWDNRPVNYISFWDAARFCNWLHNGQGSGDTESGAYINVGNQSTFARQPRARYFIPTEDEWYKAAFYDPNKPGGPGYWKFATKSNAEPINTLLTPDPGNHANFISATSQRTIGSPYYMTVVGDFENTPGPYGAFDQAGNVWEWDELVQGSGRGMRGSSWDNLPGYLPSSFRSTGNVPTTEGYEIGLRVASVPEPSTFVLLGMGAVGLLGFAWRRRRRPT